VWECVYGHVCVWDIHVSTHARLRALRQALCLEHEQADRRKDYSEGVFPTIKALCREPMLEALAF
jgi:hypothetical protein